MRVSEKWMGPEQGACTARYKSSEQHRSSVKPFETNQPLLTAVDPISRFCDDRDGGGAKRDIIRKEAEDRHE